MTACADTASYVLLSISAACLCAGIVVYFLSKVL